MKHKSILDPQFRYTPAATTDIRKLFRRIRREQAEQKTATVTEIRKVKRA